MPKPILGYYPSLYEQDKLIEKIHLIDVNGEVSTSECGHPPKYAAFQRRETYDAKDPKPLEYFGPTKCVPLGDIAMARSGDKGANLNCGIFVNHPEVYEWLRAFMSRERMVALLGQEWKDQFVIERVEFPLIHAVHFVIYGILGRGVSSSTRLDNLGKGFADFLRDKWVDIPEKFLS